MRAIRTFEEAVKYYDSFRFDLIARDAPVVCLKCNWCGVYEDLKLTTYIPEHDVVIPDQLIESCPACGDYGWEQED
jgi:hypothetical protein